MNREILFRGKRKDAPHQWIAGDLNHIDGNVYIFDRDPNSDLNSPDWYEVNPETVGQFTGLLDKEGNKIFENDVLRSVHFKEGNKTHYLYHIVKWDNRLSGWIAQNASTPNGNFIDQGNPQIWVYIKNADFDIMGPIHDHPHLLNKTSNQ